MQIKDLARAKTGQKQRTLVRTSEHPRNGGAGCRPAFTSKFVGLACSDRDRVSAPCGGCGASAVGYLLVNRVLGSVRGRGHACRRPSLVLAYSLAYSRASDTRSGRKKARRARTLRAQKSPGSRRGCRGLGGRSPLPVRPCCARSVPGCVAHCHERR